MQKTGAGVAYQDDHYLPASDLERLAGPMVTGTFHPGKMETEVLSSNF
jgi:hypothetical protein